MERPCGLVYLIFVFAGLVAHVRAGQGRIHLRGKILYNLMVPILIK